MKQFAVSIGPDEAAKITWDYVVSSGLSVEGVGNYRQVGPDGRAVVFLVFEKYFMRTSSRASLSVVIENITGITNVCFVGSGGGQNALFGFDWGAGGSFESLVEDSLARYVLR